jgi:large subunit ribosomal protein L28
MAKVCDICGKKQASGNRVSHSHRKSRRKWNVNLQRVRVNVDGTHKALSVCTRCIRSGKVPGKITV